jgi:hypothetical protein
MTSLSIAIFLVQLGIQLPEQQVSPPFKSFEDCTNYVDQLHLVPTKGITITLTCLAES